jgi:hypothetical protein
MIAAPCSWDESGDGDEDETWIVVLLAAARPTFGNLLAFSSNASEQLVATANCFTQIRGLQ